MMKKRLMDLLIEAKKAKPDDAVWSDFLVDYLVEHGVIALPCNVGDDVYWIDSDTETVQCAENDIKAVAYYGNDHFKVIAKGLSEPEDIHTDWCMLTEEEANQRLKERFKK